MAIAINTNKLFCPKCDRRIDVILKANSIKRFWYCKNKKCVNYKKNLKKAISKN